MIGTEHIIPQERDRHLLRELAVMRIADREQAKLVAGFRSTTRVNTRLLALTRAGLLKRVFVGSGGGRKAVYSLTPRGAALGEVPHRGLRRANDSHLVADFFVEHQLVINDLYCRLKYKPSGILDVAFHQWMAFHRPIIDGLALIPDGYVEFNTETGITGSFIEVDLGHESLKVWEEKVHRYFQFAVSGDYKKRFGQYQFRVLVIANSERRLRSIRTTVSKITHKIFRFTTIDAARQDFFGAIWLKPTEQQTQTLI